MQDKDFTTYEYKTISTRANEQAQTIDMYEAFGYEVIETSTNSLGNVTLSLKRDRKQKHKTELNKLLRQGEETFESIHNLNASKTRGATIFSFIFGSLASLVLGGGMCLVMLLNSNLVALIGGIIIGVIGIILCSVNPLIYNKMVAKKTKEVLPLIDQSEEKLANILEKGNELLSQDII